jgi:hypothetical protein
MNLRAEHDSLWGYLESTLTPNQLARPLLVNFNHWHKAQSALTEIALTLTKHGSDVTIAFWADKTPMPDVSWETSRLLGTLLLSPTKEQQIEKVLRKTGFPKSAFPRPPIRSWQPVEPFSIPQVLNRTSIRKMTYRGADMGRSILQVHPDTNTPMTDDFLWPRGWVEIAARSFAFAYDQTFELIERRGITVIAVFNGRFLHDRAAATAAQSLGIPVLNYDLGGLQTGFDLTIDDTHDWDALQRRMLSLYDRWDPEERDELGSSWFLDRTQHLDPLNRLFVEAQTIGSMVDLPDGKKVIVYFSSSGDEISELDLDWNDYFQSQENALELIARICAENPDIYFIVRSHPHKRRKPAHDVKEWMKAVEEANPDLHLDPHSDVDSYALMRKADLVITYGSTSGIEAAFAQKPVIVMGPSAYNILGAATQVFTESELRLAITDPTLGNWPTAVSFGLLMKRRGFNFQEIDQVSETDFRIAGHDVTLTKSLISKLSHAYKESKLARYRRTR